MTFLVIQVYFWKIQNFFGQDIVTVLLLFSCYVMYNCLQPRNCSMPGSSVLHYLLDFGQDNISLNSNSSSNRYQNFIYQNHSQLMTYTKTNNRQDLVLDLWFASPVIHTPNGKNFQSWGDRLQALNQNFRKISLREWSSFKFY